MRSAQRVGWCGYTSLIRSIGPALLGVLEDIGPRFARLELRASSNVRPVQQSVHTFSNVVDIEGFVAAVEQETGRQFLRRIDIPATERDVAMRELRAMGITAGSMFPGLDGMCRSLAERWF